MSATLLQGNKIVATQSFEVKFHDGRIRILEGEIYTIRKVFTYGVDFTFEGETESILITFKELPQSNIMSQRILQNFKDLEQIDVGRFYDDQSFQINNRIKGLLT